VDSVYFGIDWWAIGSFAGGWITTYLSGDIQYRTAFALGILLTLAGILTILMIGNPLVFTVISLPMFIIFTYLGHRYSLYSRS
jgi:hypothetical protein